MARKKSDNKIIEIKPEFESILVCNDRKLSPFIQILIQEHENIDSQSLGTLIGVFEVTDSSEDSSYIVNYLISIIKKEYFSKPKRGPIESLEASLHKANLALSNLAEHGNIDWLGKLNALVAVTEKNGLHFSQAGNASAFLLRSKMLTDISEGLSLPDGEPNPLKTFVNVSSGRMEKDDKLLIATSGIFDIFSLEEIKKSSLRFSKKEFIQFLRTALGNELERAAVLVADFSDKEIAAQKIPAKKAPEKILNAFSNNTFKNPPLEKSVIQKLTEDEIREEIQKSQSGFIDKKTGHIYIKEGLYADESRLEAPPVTFKEKIAPILENISYFFKKTFSIILDIIVSITRKGIDYFQNIPEKKAQSDDYLAPSEDSFPQQTDREKRISAYKSFFSEKNVSDAVSYGKDVASMTKPLFSKLIPNFQKIRTAVSRMDYQQKLYGILALVFVFIVPFFIARFLDEKAAEKIASEASKTVEVVALPLEKDKNVKRVTSASNVYSAENISNIIKLNDRLYIVTAREVIDPEKNTRASMPQTIDTPLYSEGMQDLNLIFVMGKNRSLISFSPTAEKFQDNVIDIPAGSDISAMGTYLTYLYLVDSKNDQIYRYPRADGGFAGKTDWLKDSTDLSDILDFSMSENLFIAKSNSVIKLFRGKNEPFAIENTATPIAISKIYVDSDSGNLIILDKTNSRAIYLNKDGQIINQYYQPELQKATNILLDEKNNLIYFSTDSALETFPLI